MARKKKEEIIEETFDVVEYSEVMKNSFVDYALSTIIDRAVPDVRDGLKPVQRRILFDMHELRITPNSQHRKCARIVGDTMGKYHPHGDSSIYDALIRMSQDFKTGNPLVDVHGNNGTIDGDVSAAMRYCVTGDTLVNTNEGLYKIKDIVSDSKENSDTKIDKEILSMNNNINKATMFFNSGKHPIKEIKTECGYSIKGSYNHPILVLKPNINAKPVLEWKTLENLKVGDYAVINLFYGGLYNKGDDMVSVREAKNIAKYTVENMSEEISENILWSSLNIQKVFLQELFRRNGVIKNKTEVAFKLNPNILKQIQIMLLQWSILSKIVEDELIVDMGYEYDNKVPFLERYLKLRYKDDECLSEDDFKHLKTLSNYEYFQITEINNLEPETVYSIRVDSDCHSFTANGFINHNTEARLSPLGQEMVKDLHPAIVEYVDNFDETEKEPTILPTLLPNLMLIGVNGLAVGFRTEIPTHNLGELVDAIIAYMGNKKITTKELMKYVKGPDYPTGGIITNKKDLLDLYETGNGKVTIRSKIEIENGTGGRKNLVITEIPYTFSGNKLKLIENLISMVKSKKLDEISDIRDESGEDIRIVLEIKKGVDIDKLLNKLYAKTKLEDSQSCSFLVVKGTTPKYIGLKDYIEEYIEFQNEVYLNKYKLMLSKAEREAEILEGLCMAYDQLDAVIETIRYAKNLSVARNCLMNGDVTDINYKTKKCQTVAKKFSFSELQSQTILDMKLQRLNKLEITSIEKNRDQVQKEIERYKKIIGSKRMLNNVIKKDLEELKEKYKQPRKTKIVESKATYVEEKVELIEEDLILLVDRFGYAKTIPTSAYSRMNEETLAMYRETIEVKNTDKLMMVANSGNLYQLKMTDIPKAKASDKGIQLAAVCKMDSDEEILMMNTFENVKNVIFVFDNGYIKKVETKEYESRQKKTVGTKLYNNKLVKVLGVNKEKTIELESNKQSHTLNVKDIPLCKKNVKGTKVVKLKKNEELI